MVNAPWAALGLDASTSALAYAAINPFTASSGDGGALMEGEGMGQLRGVPVTEGMEIVHHGFDGEEMGLGMGAGMPSGGMAGGMGGEILYDKMGGAPAPAAKARPGAGRSRQPSKKHSATVAENKRGGFKKDKPKAKKKSDSPKSKIQKVDESGERWGRWTDLEHTHFLDGLAKYGKKWKLISGMIETRSVVQIRSHAQK
jgi:SHAQKYF class myb-like DNA-binding protein